MPRYHFHSADGARDYDRNGLDLPDDQAARLAATQFAGEVLKHGPADLWSHGQWRVEVTDPDGELLFTVITIAIDAPRRPAPPPETPAND